jgi:hypothetical protein
MNNKIEIDDALWDICWPLLCNVWEKRGYADDAAKEIGLQLPQEETNLE